MATAERAGAQFPSLYTLLNLLALIFRFLLVFHHPLFSQGPLEDLDLL